MAELPQDEAIATFCSEVLRASREFFSEPSCLPWRTPKQSRDAEGWHTAYKNTSRSSSFAHDEPWLTLMAMWGLFAPGNGTRSSDERRLKAINSAFREGFLGGSGQRPYPVWTGLPKCFLEVQLPEVGHFREYTANKLRSLLPHHPYADRHAKLRSKLDGKVGSIEGNTNLDALIANGGDGENSPSVFIEAKFLSDISKDITYLPYRNQIARVIDSALSAPLGPSGRAQAQPSTKRLRMLGSYC